MRRWHIPARIGLAAVLLLGIAPASHAAVSDGGAIAGWAAAAGVWSTGPATLAPARPAPPRRGAATRSAAALVPAVPSGRWALSLTLQTRPGAALRIVDRARIAGRAACARARTGVSPSRPRPAAPGPFRDSQGRRRGHTEWNSSAAPPADWPSTASRFATTTGGAVRLVADGTAPARIQTLTVTRADRPDALLLHRLGDLEARTGRGRFPLGEGPDGRLRFSGGWTSGFWPGALWTAARLTPVGRMRAGPSAHPSTGSAASAPRSTTWASCSSARSSPHYDRLCTTPAATATPRCARCAPAASRPRTPSCGSPRRAPRARSPRTRRARRRRPSSTAS